MNGRSCALCRCPPTNPDLGPSSASERGAQGRGASLKGRGAAAAVLGFARLACREPVVLQPLSLLDPLSSSPFPPRPTVRGWEPPPGPRRGE